MKKIIQIAVSNDDLYCLTKDGKVYVRVYKKNNEKMFTDTSTLGVERGRTCWDEIKEEEIIYQ